MCSSDLGGINNGFTVQSQKPKVIIKNNHLEIRGSKWSGRGISAGGNYVATLYEVDGNTILNIDVAVTLEPGTGACTEIIRHNTIDAASTYPQVIYGGTHTPLWIDNYNTNGLDAYGAISGFAATPYFSPGSRIWSNTPSGSGVPGWICVTAGQSGTWKTMAALGA